MFSPDDTIVAVATPQGRGGIGVVRISGPDSHSVAQALCERPSPFQPRHATLTRVRTDSVSDHAVVTWFQAPQSYTGEDVVEISAHGSPILLRGIVQQAMRRGCRLAEPGEFTLRAYLNGRVDLVQAEAVRDLIEAVTPLQARTAFDQLQGTLTDRIRAIDADLLDLTSRLEASLDFPEEGYHFVDGEEAASRLDGLTAMLDSLLAHAGRGRLIREGLEVVLAGRPNAGKSSLFNQLTGAARAIVTPQPGTTRDLLTERVDVEGVPMTIVDTAGVHARAVDAAEIEGIARAAAARDVAATVVVVLDRSTPLTADDVELIAATSDRRRVVVANKADLAPAWTVVPGVEHEVVRVSALSGEGVDDLRSAIVASATGGESATEDVAITNVRHIELARRARAGVARAADAARAGTPEEFVLADLHDARHALEELTGARAPEDLLRAIFERFCIGK